MTQPAGSPDTIPPATRKPKVLSGKAQERWLSLMSPIGLLLLWEALIRAGLGDARFVPPPSTIAVTFYELALTGELWTHTWATVVRTLAGYVLGVVPAIAVGLIMAMSIWTKRIVDPLIAALFPIPKIALMPMLMLALGFGEAPKIALVAISTFFPVVIAAYVGGANIEKIYLDVAHNFGANKRTLLRRVIFFGALPMIFAALRLAIGIAFIVIIAAEFVSSEKGIGTLIWSSWQLLLIDRMFVGIIVIGILGVIFSQLIAELERVVIPWRRQQ